MRKTRTCVRCGMVYPSGGYAKHANEQHIRSPSPSGKGNSSKMRFRTEDIVRRAQAGNETLEEIGQTWGITRERVRQILVAEGVAKVRRVPQERIPLRYCKACGIPYRKGEWQQHLRDVYHVGGWGGIRPVIHAEMIDYYYQHGSRATAAKFGVSVSTIYNTLRRRNMNPISDYSRRGRNVHGERNHQIYLDFMAGMTYRECAEKHGLSEFSIAFIVGRERRAALTEQINEGVFV